MNGNKKLLLLAVIVWSTLTGVVLSIGVLTKYPSVLTGVLLSPDFYKNVFSKSPKIYAINSGSMEPAIKTGSVVITLPADKYKNGDIITFTRNSGRGEHITHRIVSTKIDPMENSIIYSTKGDANEETDNWEVKPNQIVGKNFLTIPFLGYGVDFAKQPAGFIFLVIVPATIVIYEELKNVLREIGRFFSKFRKKSSDKAFPKKAALVPIFGALLFIGVFSTAYFTDIEESFANVLGASSSYGEKTAPLFVSDPFDCSSGATDFNSPQAKTVVLKISGGQVQTKVALEGATPNSSYDIWINQDPGGCPLGAPTEVGAITTDGAGNGVGDAEASLVLGATNFWVSAVGGGQVIRSVSVTLP